MYRILVCFLLLAAGPAAAGPGWRFALEPYVWGASLAEIDVTTTLDRMFDDMDPALYLVGTARRGGFVVRADLSVADLGGHYGVDLGGWFDPLAVDVRVRTTAATLGLGYALVDRPRVGLDLFAGARHLDVDADARVVLATRTRARTIARRRVDPVVGAAARLQLTPALAVNGYGDYGGLADEGSSWQAVGTLSYAVGERWSIAAGYRALGFEEEDAPRFDGVIGGPILGASLRF